MSSSSRRPSHTAVEPGHSPMMTSADANMPMRFPRPLSAAELHLELEREQEAVVNRLSRELTALRAQHSASVASNASQNSAMSYTPGVDGISTRQHRSSSNASSRSINTPSSTAQTTPLHHPQPSTFHPGVSQASFDRAAAVGAPNSSISRNPSIRSASGQNTPAQPQTHRPSISQAMSVVSTAGSFLNTPSSQTSNPMSPYPPTPASANSTDAATARAELEAVKAENEALRQRVKALERALRSRRGSMHSDASVQREPSVTRPNVGAWAANSAMSTTGTNVAGPRERSESQSTTASTRRPDVALEREDSINVGESAANLGLALR